MSKEQNKNKKKTKYRLQVMDIITIVFTAAILGIMGYVLYDHFSDGNEDVDIPKQSHSASATAAPTKEPTLSDIGNIYGNITNDANVVVIDNREYFISADDNGDKHIYVTSEDVTTDLIKTNASCLNVVSDYVTYADKTSVTPYYVFYINGDGKICFYYDYPGSDNVVDESLFKENIFLDGTYLNIDVSGEFVYHLNTEGIIAKTSIIEKKTEFLSSERAYKNFVLYFGTIYAMGEDGCIYKMASTTESESSASATPTATPTAANTTPAPKETVIVSSPVEAFVVDEDWIYVIDKNGVSRYIAEGVDEKDSLITADVDSINVLDDAIFYYTDGKLYTSTANLLLLGNSTELGAISSVKGINLSKKSVYVVNENGKLCKSTYDSKTETYSAFTEMN